MFEMPTIFSVANFDSIFEIVSETKQGISWNLGCIFLNDSLRAWLHAKMYVTLWMNLNAFFISFCENSDIFKNNEVISVLQYDLHSFKIRHQSIAPYLFEETKILILTI